MRFVRLTALFNSLVMVLFTVTFVLIGFGHQMPQAQDTARAEALSSGLYTDEDLCGDPAGPAGATMAECPVCVLLGAALVPTTPSEPTRAQGAPARRVLPANRILLGHFRDPARATRAPPFA